MCVIFNNKKSGLIYFHVRSLLRYTLKVHQFAPPAADGQLSHERVWNNDLAVLVFQAKHV